MWTSGAQSAHWMVLLARTDPDASKHQGISSFLLNMKTPGITVRPLVLMNIRDVFLPERLYGLLTASFQKSTKELRTLLNTEIFITASCFLLPCPTRPKRHVSHAKRQVAHTKGQMGRTPRHTSRIWREGPT